MAYPNKMATKNLLPLPRVCGPKLAPFRGTASADIEFIEFLGSDKDLDSKVWKVCINGKIYALKIVSEAFNPLVTATDMIIDCCYTFTIPFPLDHFNGQDD